MKLGANFDWGSFFPLLHNDKGVKCKLNIPDTILFERGLPSAWWYTNKEGNVQRHGSSLLTMDAMQHHFNTLAAAQVEGSGQAQFVAVLRAGDGRPQLLRPHAFSHICSVMQDRTESGRIGEGSLTSDPAVLQFYIQPISDVRYVASYANLGTSATCHTFQLRHSRRYAPLGQTSHQEASAEDWTALANAVSLGAAALEGSGEAETGDQPGPVDPATRAVLRRTTHSLVKYIQRAHGLALRGIVCEYIRGTDGQLVLLAVLAVEWASNSAGRGAGSYASGALLSECGEDPGWEDLLEDDSSSPLSSPKLAPEPSRSPREKTGGPAVPDCNWSPRCAGAAGSSRATTPQGNSKSPLLQLPGSSAVAATQALNLVNSWPSAPHQQHMNTAYTPPVGGSARPPSPMSNRHSAPPANQRFAGRVARSDEPGSAKAWRPHSCVDRSHTVPTHPALRPSTAHMPGTITPPRSHGRQRAGRGVSPPVMSAALVREVESLRDELLYQHQMAEASALKVRQLEDERASAASAFAARTAELEHNLADNTTELEVVRADRLVQRRRAEAAEAKCAQLEAELQRQSGQLNEERTTTLNVLRDYQLRDTTMKEQTEQMSKETQDLTARLQEEQAAVVAFKRQLLEYQGLVQRLQVASSQDGNTPGALEEGVRVVMKMVKPLVDVQLNPQGEEYAVAKLLQTYVGQLRGAFVFYCQAESASSGSGPSMLLRNWNLFCQATELSDFRPGARIRSTNSSLMISPQQCEEIFKAYSHPDITALVEKPPQVLSYESFQAAVVHAAHSVKRSNVPFLSEAVRDFILRYLSKAQKLNQNATAHKSRPPRSESPRPQTSPSSETPKSHKSSKKSKASSDKGDGRWQLSYSGAEGPPATGRPASPLGRPGSASSAKHTVLPLPML